MKRKLTLTVEEKLVAWAKNKKINISNVLEEALRIEKELDDIRVGDGYSNLRR